jgi:ABC-type Fe3+/spermidine/putrescine transport system ATPase subunit
MSDRIALMRNGRIEQLSGPQEMYDRPISRYVADFIGESNLLKGTVRQAGGQAVSLDVAGVTLEARSARLLAAGTEAWLSVRPEFVTLASGPSAGGNLLAGIVKETVFAGPVTRLYAELGDGSTLVANLPAGTAPPAKGRPVCLTWPLDRGVCVTD